MTVVKAKQIEGVVDTKSNQTVQGRKRFTVPQAFVGGTTTMVAYRDAMYWCKREDVLNEAGNSRLTMEDGRLITEVFDGKNWITNDK